MTVAEALAAGGWRPMSVLVSSAGRRIELLEHLREAAGGPVVAVDADATAPALHLADHGEVVPRLDSGNFIDRVLDICRRRQVRLIVPTIDTELALYAANATVLGDAGVRVAVAGEAAVATALDKLMVARRLGDAGVPAVETTSWDPGPAPFGFPTVVKPRRGAAGLGVRVVPDDSEWCGPPRTGEWVVQPLVRGREVTVDCVATQEGRVVALGARERLKVRGGEVERARTLDGGPFVSLASLAARVLGLEGPFNVQLFLEPDGAVCVGEVNPRFGGGMPLSQRAGAPLAQAVCHWAACGSWPAGEPALAGSGHLMLRYDRAVYADEGPSR